MHPTLFYIPDQIFGLPLFGAFGVLFWLWAAGSLIAMLRQVRQQGLNADTLGLAVLLGLLGAVVVMFLPRLLEHVSPQSAELGLPIRGYGVMVLIGVVSGVALAIRRAKRRGIDPEAILSLALWMFVGGIVGARAFYVIEYWKTQFYRPDDLGGTVMDVLNIAKGGLVVYGALIGGAATSFVFLVRFRLPVLRIADIVAPSMALGLGIGRIGCFLNGCCYGGVCDLPWAVQFPQESPPYMKQWERKELFVHGIAMAGAPEDHGAVVAAVEAGSAAEKAGLKAGDHIGQIVTQAAGETPQSLYPKVDTRETASGIERVTSNTVAAAQRALLTASGEGTKLSIRVTRDGQPVEQPLSWTITAADEPPSRSQPVHPTQLYSAIDAILLCLLLLAFDPLRRHEGEVFALMLTVHAVSRFALESIRRDEPKQYFGMSISQFLSVVMLVVAVALWAYLWRQPLVRRPSADIAAAR